MSNSDLKDPSIYLSPLPPPENRLCECQKARDAEGTWRGVPCLRHPGEDKLAYGLLKHPNIDFIYAACVPCSRYLNGKVVSRWIEIF